MPAALRAALAGSMEVYGEAELPAAGFSAVLVHARAEMRTAVRRFRESGGLEPVFGYAEHAPGVQERLEWVRHGADDLVHAPVAARRILQRVRSHGTLQRDEAESVPSAIRVDRYLLAVDNYHASRRDLLRRLGDRGAERFLACVSLRDQVLRAADQDVALAPPTDRRGSTRTRLNWPVMIAGEPDLAVDLRNVGADGVGIALDTEPAPGEVLDLVIDGLNVSAELELELRWTRPSEDRWEAGGFTTRLTITRSP